MNRSDAVQVWLEALRRHAGADELRALPLLTLAESAQVMAALRAADPPAPAAAAATAVRAAIGPTMAPTRFQPRLVLLTLTRGDGLLGLKPSGAIGPRGDQVTIARIDWTYLVGDRVVWDTPAPPSVLNVRPPARHSVLADDGRRITLARDLAAEREAHERVWSLGLQPLAEKALQWRSREAEQAAPDHRRARTLPQEAQFAALWADEVPRLQAEGWLVVVQPGFAHLSAAVTGWRIVVDADTGHALGRTPLGRVEPGVQVVKLGQPEREGSWMLSLGIEVDGELLDLAPLLADLLRRDGRWLDATRLAAIPDHALIQLHAPGGRRIDAPARPLKAIVGAMLDLLTDPRRVDGPLKLSAWDALRLEALRIDLTDSQAARAGTHGTWQLQGEAGLRVLADRLRAAGTPPPVEPPAGLGIVLRPYQLAGLAWLQYLSAQRLAGVLADEMGLGKTAQVLAHVLCEKQAGRLASPALVVMPTTLLFNWRAEAERVAPALRVLTLHGSERASGHAGLGEHDLVLTSYPLVWRDIDMLDKHDFHLLVLDEAQAVKNAGTRAADAVRRIRATHRLCMTGTPLENHLGELWAQFDFLLPGFLGDARTFARRWRKPIEENGETLRAQLLAQRVRPFILRRRKADVAAELPAKTEVIEHVQLQGAQRELYESVRIAADTYVRRVLARRGFAGAQIAVLDALLKLRQVCCDPLLVTGSTWNDAAGRANALRAARSADLPRAGGTDVPMPRAKIERLMEMLPALVGDGRRVLVFSQFAQMLALIQQRLDEIGLPWVALTGRTPPARRAERVARFQAREVPVFLISLKAGGTGLNLTAADTVIHVDPWWNPAVERQATDRAHRIGQQQPVMVYRLVVEGSIEERMLALQARKAALADGVLGSDGAATLKFGPDDLDALLAPLDAGLASALPSEIRRPR